MLKKTRVLLPLATLLALPIYADVTTGVPPDAGTGNCFPWGCAYNAEYQQVYNSSDFTGPITITGLKFYNTQFDSGSTQTPAGTYDIHLSTTAVNSTTISGTYSSNIGADNTDVFTGSINQPWAFGDTLVITFSTPFTYNPLTGNLLMDVTGSGISLPGGATYFDVQSSSPDFTRVYCPSGISCTTGVVDTAYGLTTTFVTGTSTVPEPAFLPILAGALGLLAIARFARRKRATQE